MFSQLGPGHLSPGACRSSSQGLPIEAEVDSLPPMLISIKDPLGCSHKANSENLIKLVLVFVFSIVKTLNQAIQFPSSLEYSMGVTLE